MLFLFWAWMALVLYSVPLLLMGLLFVWLAKMIWKHS